MISKVHVIALHLTLAASQPHSYQPHAKGANPADKLHQPPQKPAAVDVAGAAAARTLPAAESAAGVYARSPNVHPKTASTATSLLSPHR